MNDNIDVNNNKKKLFLSPEFLSHQNEMNYIANVFYLKKHFQKKIF